MAPVVLESRRFLVMEQVSWFVYRVSVTSGRVVYGGHSVVIAFLGPPCSPARCSPPSPSFFLLLPSRSLLLPVGSARYAVPIFFGLLSLVPFASDELPGPRLAITRLYTHYISSGASTGGSPPPPCSSRAPSAPSSVLFLSAHLFSGCSRSRSPHHQTNGIPKCFPATILSRAHR